MFRSPPTFHVRSGDHVTVLGPRQVPTAIGMRIVATTTNQWTLAPWDHRIPDWPQGSELVVRATTPEGLVTGTAVLTRRDSEWTLTVRNLRLSDRRRSERIPIKVRILYGPTRPELATYTRDLGSYGCLIDGRSPGMVGDPCHVELRWGVDRSVHLLSQIIRVEPLPLLSFAVAFLDIKRSGWDRWEKAWRDIQQWHRSMNSG